MSLKFRCFIVVGHLLVSICAVIAWTVTFVGDHGQDTMLPMLQDTRSARQNQHHFSFSNCNNTPVPMLFHNLTILPDPIVMALPTYGLGVYYNFTVTEDIGVNKLELDLSLRLKTFGGYTELCSILGEKVCHLGNVCEWLKKIENCYLPECTCPIKKGRYALPSQINVSDITSPPFLLKGAFQFEMELQELGRPIACLRVNFCINDCSHVL